MTAPPPTASFHLFRVPPAKAGIAVLRMGLDRGPLLRTPGLRFSKLVGTGDGRTFTVRDADPTRWGLFGVWDSPAALHRFEETSAVHAAWRGMATETWRVQLAPLRSRGTWGGTDPLGGVRRERDAGPVVALTRARLRWRLAPRFWRSVPPVSAALQGAAGLRFAVGFGEAPIGLQGTLSVWESPAALTAFAYGTAQHRQAIEATSALGWYREELFARFAVEATDGTLDGVDPLAGLVLGASR